MYCRWLAVHLRTRYCIVPRRTTSTRSDTHVGPRHRTRQAAVYSDNHEMPIASPTPTAHRPSPPIALKLDRGAVTVSRRIFGARLLDNPCSWLVAKATANKAPSVPANHCLHRRRYDSNKRENIFWHQASSAAAADSVSATPAADADSLPGIPWGLRNSETTTFHAASNRGGSRRLCAL